MAYNNSTTMHGNPLTLEGVTLKVGDTAPDFHALSNELEVKKLSDYGNSYKFISVVPSLDTSVCDLQTRKVNDEALNFSDDVVVLTLSMDLPFAQARWCGASGADKIITLSDHKDADFGRKFGVLIEEMRLLNRSIFILDKDNVVRYIEIVQENSNHPDYEKALKALKDVVSG
ncbi:MAG: thiol peroxidase [Spirochaetia bacterium]|nr:thiol peroxidase [Spirochaetia bacterium]